MGDRRQIDIPNTVAELSARSRAAISTARRVLPDAASAGQGDQPVVGQQLPHLAHLRFAPNETRELHRKIVRTNSF